MTEISDDRRIGLHNLEAIERGNLDQLPPGVYVRAFVKSYARCVQTGAEVQALLNSLYEQQQSVVRIPDIAINFTKNDVVIVDGSSTPPKLGEYLLYLVLTKAERVYLIGDLTEEYNEVLAKFGRRAADVWFYRSVLRSLAPLVIRWAKGIKSIVVLIELIERMFRK